VTPAEPSNPVPGAKTPGELNHPYVHVDDQQIGHELDLDRYRTLAEDVLRGEDVPDGAELTVVFVSPQAMADLNTKHMGQQGPTDVLAFPIDGHVADQKVPAPTPILLGDVVICPAVAATNCSTHKHSYPGHDGSVTDEIDLLVVHGILHVLGMDHADDEERNLMQASERDHLAAFRDGDH